MKIGNIIGVYMEIVLEIIISILFPTLPYAPVSPWSLRECIQGIPRPSPIPRISEFALRQRAGFSILFCLSGTLLL